MIRLTRRTPRTLAAALALASIPLLAGCNEEAAPATKATVKVEFDQALHDRLPTAIRTRNVLRVGAESTSYPPMWSFGSDKRTLVGFEPDLADALGKVLGVDFEFIDGEFQVQLDRLNEGTIDAVLTSMTDTPERERRADFVNYLSAGTVILVQRGNPHRITSLKDLCGRVATVEEATVQQDLLERSQKMCGARPIVIDLCREMAQGQVRLRTGRSAAVLLDYPPAAAIATNPETRAYYQLASSKQYEPSPYGIAVAKNQPALRDAIHDALDQLIRSGAYVQLAERWNLSEGRIRTASINGGAAARS